MKFATVEQIRKLKQSGPRNKDREFWGISRKDINSSNYNIWSVWMDTVIEWLEKRTGKNRKSAGTE